MAALVLFDKTPEWLDSDSCQKCDQPFFWNFKQMWDSKKIGLRQVGDMCSIRVELSGRTQPYDHRVVAPWVGVVAD